MAQVGIFVGTVYGNALLVAEEAENILKDQGHEVKLFDEGTLEDWQHYRQHYVLVITSTTGQGDFPDSIASLFVAVRDQVGFQPSYAMVSLRSATVAMIISAVLGVRSMSYCRSRARHGLANG